MEELEQVYKAVRKILPEGELYAVGGCVRDALLGKTPKDWDFCTNLTPEQMKPFVKAAGRKVYDIGEKFGTLGFKVPVIEHNKYDYENDWGPQWDTRSKYVRVEVTTYRSEKYTPGSRKPEVSFGTSLREDLKRRDFTINAMAYDGKLVDLFASELDLQGKRIKSVGDPKQMLTDDPLRILRALRFSIQLGFEIEQNLFRHLKRFCPKLFDVAIERQVMELDKMFSLDPNAAISLLKEIGWIKYFLPELYTEFSQDKLVKIRGSIQKTDIDHIWKQILCNTGEFWEENDYGEFYLTNNNHKRSSYLNQGIATRFKFSNKRKELL